MELSSGLCLHHAKKAQRRAGGPAGLSLARLGAQGRSAGELDRAPPTQRGMVHGGSSASLLCHLSLSLSPCEACIFIFPTVEGIAGSRSPAAPQGCAHPTSPVSAPVPKPTLRGPASPSPSFVSLPRALHLFACPFSPGSTCVTVGWQGSDQAGACSTGPGPPTGGPSHLPGTSSIRPSGVLAGIHQDPLPWPNSATQGPRAGERPARALRPYAAGRQEDPGDDLGGRGRADRG